MPEQEVEQMAQRIMDEQGHLIVMWMSKSPVPAKGTCLKGNTMRHAFTRFKPLVVSLGPATFEEYAAQQLRFHNVTPPPGWTERNPDQRYMKVVAE